MRRTVFTIGVVAAAALAAPALSGSWRATAEKPKRAPIYDETADAAAQIDAAVARAKRANRRVLLQLGTNDSDTCHEFHALCKKDEQIARELSYEFELVLVDCEFSIEDGATDGNDRNVKAIKKLGTRFQGFEPDRRFGPNHFVSEGCPYLIVLDADGKAIAEKNPGQLGDLREIDPAREFDPAKVLAFLRENRAEPLDAAVVLDAALARAAKDRKGVFLHVGAPGCVWCRRLDAWLADPAVATTMGSSFVEVGIDLARMTNGKAVGDRFRADPTDGIPWFAFLDFTGALLATSDGPQGNVGFPREESEIAYFGEALRKAGMSNADTETLVASLRALREAKDR